VQPLALVVCEKGFAWIAESFKTVVQSKGSQGASGSQKCPNDGLFCWSLDAILQLQETLFPQVLSVRPFIDGYLKCFDQMGAGRNLVHPYKCIKQGLS
jgi:hypothetical protein